MGFWARLGLIAFNDSEASKLTRNLVFSFCKLSEFVYLANVHVNSRLKAIWSSLIHYAKGTTNWFKGLGSAIMLETAQTQALSFTG